MPPRVHGRASQARHGCRPDQCSKVFGAEEGPPSQGWRTLLRNHADGIAAIDLFVVPTIAYRLLYGLLIMQHGRRQMLWLGVTEHTTAERVANQLTQAIGWEQAPRYLIRDRDAAYGEVFARRVRSPGIRDRPTSPRSLGRVDTQNGSSIQSARSALIKWSYSVSVIFGICFSCT